MYAIKRPRLLSNKSAISNYFDPAYFKSQNMFLDIELETYFPPNLYNFFYQYQPLLRH